LTEPHTRLRGQIASVYVHFPWCLAKCPYCDFVSYAAPREAIDHDGYADAVVRELTLRAPSFAGRDVASVFFGGGTPSLWKSSAIGRVLRAAKELLATTADLEVTVECNPTSLDAEVALSLRDVGVTRLSVGTQALREEQLRYLGRLHDMAGAAKAVEDALASGLRVSTDLIFGMPDQTPEDACAQACELADRGLSHLSCYQLTIEPGTQFGELARRGRLKLADPGHVADSFLAIDEALESRGLRHYEISNYAKTGEESRHNLGYWHGDEYLGVGCAAYGFVRQRGGDGTGGAGVRFRNDPAPAAYQAREDARTGETEEALDGETMLRERIMLGLRLADGFDLEAAAADLGVTAWTKDRTREAEKLVARERLVVEGGRLRIPRAAWLWADDTAARLFT
jgi:oxygen-independent coproporphyrinogen-3 oxidase